MFTNQRALAGVSAVCLALAAGTMASPAMAATAPTVVSGKITQVTSTTLKVKTSTGTVTGKIASIAVITKSVKTSLSAVTKGSFARLVFASNGKTVTQISVGTVGGFGGRRPAGTTPRPGGFTGTPRGNFAGRFHGGTVASISKTAISIKSFQGKTTSYPLSKTVTVMKSEKGTKSDLKVGETVRIIPMRSNNTTFSLTIVSG